MMHLLTQFLLALFATAGFCVIFRVPVRHIPICMIIGGLGWVTYEISMYCYASPSIGCFSERYAFTISLRSPVSFPTFTFVGTSIL